MHISAFAFLGNTLALRPQILQMNGLSMRDFKTHSEALKMADNLISRNMVEFEHKGEVLDPDEDNPLLIKTWYVQSHGKKRTYEQVVSKELHATADIKSAKQLASSSAFVEGMGLTADHASAPNVKIENVAFSEMVIARDYLRPTYESYDPATHFEISM